MRSLLIHTAPIALVVLLAAVALAADLRWGELAQLVALPSVQSELHITPDQKVRITSLADELQGSSASRSQARDALAKILTAEQLDRLEQASLQVLDGLALEEPAMGDQLKLSDDQRKAVKTVVAENAADEREMNDVMKRARFPNAKSRRDFVKKYRLKASERFLRVLTPPQKEQFQKLKGKPLSEPVEAP
jgi:Spy/CpxP family protein refolding chaperone